ncbi:MAG: hypothetical protein VX589_00705 [Myxococcota bacterium]|nr:hypothetical protein [Myxococcota bacterium]
MLLKSSECVVEVELTDVRTVLGVKNLGAELKEGVHPSISNGRGLKAKMKTFCLDCDTDESGHLPSEGRQSEHDGVALCMVCSRLASQRVWHLSYLLMANMNEHMKT